MAFSLKFYNTLAIKIGILVCAERKISEADNLEKNVRGFTTKTGSSLLAG